MIMFAGELNFEKEVINFLHVHYENRMRICLLIFLLKICDQNTDFTLYQSKNTLKLLTEKHRRPDLTRGPPLPNAVL